MEPHPASAGLAAASVSDLARELTAGSITAVEVVERLLERVAAIDGPGPIELRSVLALAPDALAVAAERDTERHAGRVRGPLHGVPILVKDNIETVGLPGSAGSLALSDRPVQRDAPVVSALRDAGAIILGATNLSEWANIRSDRSTSGWSAVGGLTANPWALAHSAGGSSAGSGAAVAAGLAPLALGTETDGSITCPASLNGCAGLKPTVGLLSGDGIIPVTRDQDAPGPLARSVADLALALDALTRSDRHAIACGTIELNGLVVGVARGWETGHVETDACFETVLRGLKDAGVSVIDVAVADPSEVLDDEFAAILHGLADDLTDHLARRPGPGVHSLADVVAFNRDHAAVELAPFGQEFFEQALELGGRAAPGYLERRSSALRWANTSLGSALPPESPNRVLLAPTYAPAWTSDLATGDPQEQLGGRSTHAAAIAGWPILTIPMGAVDGLPVGLGIIARPDTERDLVAVGHAIEAAIGLVGTPAIAPRWRPRPG